jgi:hypothetical protein
VLLGLASGSPWARTFAMFGAGVQIIGVAILLLVYGSEMGPGAWWLLSALALLEAFWVYVLQKDETVAHFSPRR